jgi:hypothetical protein
MTDIVEFLTARLAEDQADAEAAIADRSDTEHWEAKGFPERDRVEWIVRDVEEKYASHGYPGHTPVAGIVPGGPRDGGGVAAHIARHDPARVLAEVKAKRKLIERHTSGVIRTYHCANGDHIQEWQCERAKEPYDESRYCEVCDVDCDELPILAAPYDQHPDFNPAWRVDS